MGRHPNESPEARARRLAYAKEYNKRYYESEKGRAKCREAGKKWRDDQGEKLLAKKREHYLKNKERYKENNKRFYERAGVTAAEYWRRWRRDNPDFARESQKRQHERGVRYILADFRAGRIDFDEFDRRFRAAIVRINERCKFEQSSGHQRDLQLRKTDPQPDET